MNAFRMESVTALERNRYITPAEFTDKLLPAARKDPEAWMLFYVVGNLGLRVIEAHRMLAEDVSKDDAFVRIRTAKQRKDTIHDLRVPEEVAVRLRKYIREHGMKPSDAVFPWSKRKSQALWDVYARKAGLKVKRTAHHTGRGIHALRHMRGLLLADRGVSPVVIRTLLRQRSITSTEVYMHTVEDRKIVDKIGALG